jgi:hypothetical protein
MIRFIELASYKQDRQFTSLSQCLEHYIKLMLDDYETDKLEIETTIPWFMLNDGFTLTEIPKGIVINTTNWISDKMMAEMDMSEGMIAAGTASRTAIVLEVKFDTFIITSTGIKIQCKIEKKRR